MNSNRTRLVAGAVILLSAPLALAVAPSLILTNFTGTLRIHQAVPCGGTVDRTTTVAAGRMDITPSLVRADVIGPIAQFHLTRLEMFYTPFSVHHECNGIGGTLEFREIGVRLASSVRFTGQALGDGRFSFTIPKEQFLLYVSAGDNLPVPQPQTAYKRPSEDVTGVIDLGRGPSSLRVTLASRLRFRLGCIRKRCLIDELLDGSQTTEVSGRIYVPGTDTDADGVQDLTDNCPLVSNPDQSPVVTPELTPPADVTVSSCQSHDIGTAVATDVCHARPVAISNNAPAKFMIGPNQVTWRASDGIGPAVTALQEVTVAGVDATPPTLSCTPTSQPRRRRIAAADDCGGRTTVKLGSFTLAHDEVIQIEETGKPGVRLLGTVGADGIRHFQVGKGEAFIMATDASGNVARASCNPALDIAPRK